MGSNNALAFTIKVWSSKSNRAIANVASPPAITTPKLEPKAFNWAAVIVIIDDVVYPIPGSTTVISVTTVPAAVILIDAPVPPPAVVK